MVVLSGLKGREMRRERGAGIAFVLFEGFVC